MVARLLAPVVLLSLACAGCGGPPPVKPDVVMLVDISEGKPVKDRCEQAPDLAFRNQVVAAAPFAGPTGIDEGALVLTVDPGQWRNLGYGLRQQIVAIIDCADAGPGKYHATIYVAAPDKTAIMKITTPELMRWRAEGLAAPTGLRADEVSRDAAIPNTSPIDPGAPAQ